MLNSGKPVLSTQNMGGSGLSCPAGVLCANPALEGFGQTTADGGLGTMGPTAVGLMLLCASPPFCGSTETCRALGLKARIQPGGRPIYWEVTSVGGNHMQPFHFNVNEPQQATLNVARCRWISCLLKASHSPSPCSIIFSLYVIKVEKMAFFVFPVT